MYECIIITQYGEVGVRPWSTDVNEQGSRLRLVTTSGLATDPEMYEMAPLDDGLLPGGGGITMWCNENGWALGLPENEKASALWRKAWGTENPIRGNVVITGDGDDEAVGLTAKQKEAIFSVVGPPTL